VQKKSTTKKAHLTIAERKVIQQLNSKNVTQSEIARLLGKHRSRICRELNNPNNLERVWVTWFRGRKHLVKRYSAEKAHANYQKNKKRCGAKRAHTKFPKVIPEIEKRFFASGTNSKTRYSLDAIIGRMRLEGWETFDVRTMYNYVRSDATKIQPHDLLHMVSRKRNKKRENKENKRILGTSIEQRPDYINKREKFGHYEGDTIVDGSHNSMLAKTERLSRFFILRKLPRHTAVEVEKIEAELKRQFFQLSTTYDNGSEFYRRAEHDNEEHKSFFTHPGSPQEKGGTENNNGIARRHWPKGTNLANIPIEEVMRVEDHINNMPRKKLGYRTAREVHSILSKIYAA